MTESDPRTMSPAAMKFAHDMLDGGMTIIDAAKRFDREIEAAIAAERARLLADTEPIVFTKECGCGGTIMFNYMPLIDELIGKAIAAERARCAAWMRHWQDHAYQSIKSGHGVR
jgi:hypothetical protein